MIGRKCVGNLHADEGAANDDYILTFFFANGGENGFHVGNGSKEKDVGEILEAGERKGSGVAACGKDEFGVGVGFAGFGGDGFLAEVYTRHLVLNGLDGGRVEPFLRAPLKLGGISQQSFGKLGTVDGEIWFSGNQSHGECVALFSERLDCSNGPAASVWEITLACS